MYTGQLWHVSLVLSGLTTWIMAFAARQIQTRERQRDLQKNAKTAACFSVFERLQRASVILAHVAKHNKRQTSE